MPSINQIKKTSPPTSSRLPLNFPFQGCQTQTLQTEPESHRLQTADSSLLVQIQCNFMGTALDHSCSGESLSVTSSNSGLLGDSMNISVLLFPPVKKKEDYFLPK